MFRNLRFVYITTPSKEEARKIGRILVEENHVKCVNIIDGMESIYKWEGKIVEEKECVLIAKTAAHRLLALNKRVKELHSYDCPCVISLDVDEEEGNAEYLNWLMGDESEFTPL